MSSLSQPSVFSSSPFQEVPMTSPFQQVQSPLAILQSPNFSANNGMVNSGIMSPRQNSVQSSSIQSPALQEQQLASAQSSIMMQQLLQQPVSQLPLTGSEQDLLVSLQNTNGSLSPQQIQQLSSLQQTVQQRLSPSRGTPTTLMSQASELEPMVYPTSISPVRQFTAAQPISSSPSPQMSSVFSSQPVRQNLTPLEQEMLTARGYSPQQQMSTPQSMSPQMYSSPQQQMTTPQMYSSPQQQMSTPQMYSSPQQQMSQPMMERPASPIVTSVLPSSYSMSEQELQEAASQLPLTAEQLRELTPDEIQMLSVIQKMTPEQIEDAYDQDLDSMVEQAESQKGTLQQLASFFDKYRQHRRLSSKCYLDGNYFWKVMAPYKGLVHSEIFARINQGEFLTNEDGELTRNFDSRIWWDATELAATKGHKERYRIVKLLIDISDSAESNTGAVHANLIYIDTLEKEIVRFEPMSDPYFTDVINAQLEEFLTQDGVLPGYSYRMLEEHPQLPVTESCPSKGMCAAYVLKKAMLLVTGRDAPLDGTPGEEEKKILAFADAIESEYGPLEGEPRYEGAFSIGLGLAPIGAYAPVCNPYLDAYCPYPAVEPVASLGFGPSYYGFGYGPRYARAPGWGWGAGRMHNPGLAIRAGRGGGRGGGLHMGGHGGGRGGGHRGTHGSRIQSGKSKGRSRSKSPKTKSPRSKSKSKSRSKSPKSKSKSRSKSRSKSPKSKSKSKSKDQQNGGPIAAIDQDTDMSEQGDWMNQMPTQARAQFGCGCGARKGLQMPEQGSRPQFGCGCGGRNSLNNPMSPSQRMYGGGCGWDRRSEEGVGSTAAGVGVGIVGGALVGGPVGAVVGGIVGGISGNLVGREKSQKSQTAGGALGGAALGAVVGGPIGAVVGGPIGAVVGGTVGAVAGNESGSDGQRNANQNERNRRPEEGVKSTATGVGIGILGGALVGGPVGAVVGGIVGGISGHLAGHEQSRKSQTAGGVLGGIALGGILGGPIGAIVGGTLGGIAGDESGHHHKKHHHHKHGEHEHHHKHPYTTSDESSQERPEGHGGMHRGYGHHHHGFGGGFYRRPYYSPGYYARPGLTFSLGGGRPLWGWASQGEWGWGQVDENNRDQWGKTSVWNPKAYGGAVAGQPMNDDQRQAIAGATTANGYGVSGRADSAKDVIMRGRPLWGRDSRKQDWGHRQQEEREWMKRQWEKMHGRKMSQVQLDALIGVAAGATTGALLFGSWTGALMGGAVGGMTGYVIGRQGSAKQKRILLPRP